jgi:hypothetical protein
MLTIVLRSHARSNNGGINRFHAACNSLPFETVWKGQPSTGSHQCLCFGCQLCESQNQWYPCLFVDSFSLLDVPNLPAFLGAKSASTESTTTTTNLRRPSLSRNLDSVSMIDVGGRQQAKKAKVPSTKGSGTPK